MYAQWVSVLGFFDGVTGGFRLRDLAFAATLLAALLAFLALLQWRAYRMCRRLAGTANLPSTRGPRHGAAMAAPANITFYLRLLVAHAAWRFAGRAQAKGLRFKTAVAADLPPWVRADPSSLTLVLTSLLDNAVKFTDEGAVRLEVIFIPDAGRRPSVQFNVYDTGAGIDSETLTRLLESEVPAGFPTGDGLAGARRLVARMGGTMGAESEPRGGSTFWFSVPVEIVEPARAVRPKRLQKPAPVNISAQAPLLPEAARERI